MGKCSFCLFFCFFFLFLFGGLSASANVVFIWNYKLELIFLLELKGRVLC